MSHIDVSSLLDFGTADEYRKLDLPPPIRQGTRLSFDAESLEILSKQSFIDIAYFYPKGHLEKLSAILDDEKASENEKFVALTLLRNAVISSEGIYPMCQDTGTALIYGWKGAEYFSDSKRDDAEALACGAGLAYKERRLRNSQLGPLAAIAEKNTQDNLPAFVDIRLSGDPTYRFLFAAKGGGSTSKASLTMESPSILSGERLKETLAARIAALGTSACPPYTIGIVLGGATPSQALAAMELAVYGMFDTLPEQASGDGTAIRSREWEAIALGLARATKAGAQWGGSHLALETRFIRLARHAANLPLAIGVSCSAHRKARAYLDESGWYLEEMERDPGRLVPKNLSIHGDELNIDLSRPLEEWLGQLQSLPCGTRLTLSGEVCLARDAAHRRIADGLAEGREMPSYMAMHPVFYAGPTEALPGNVSGSFGPTTSSRMDNYLEPLLSKGGSLVSIGKGGRSASAKRTLATHKGVYLACIGGAAAITARDHIIESRIVDYSELGMEAVRIVSLDKLPAIVIIDSKGSDFYENG